MFCVAIGLQKNLTLHFPSFISLILLPIIALVLVAIGVVIRVLAFKEIRNTHRIEHLVTSGIYSKTRNPIYLSFAFIVLGIALLFDSIPAYIWVLISWISLYWVAKKEESDLEQVFGEEYTRYKARVPMFLGRSRQNESKKQLKMSK